MELLEALVHLIIAMLKLLFNPFVLIPVSIKLFIFYKNYTEYKDSTYYQLTQHSYWSVRNNLGRYGEYLTYNHLKDFEKNGAKFLFNVYIPKGNGETTEIDVLMICSHGIFVFESKNYSGWIFGNESQKNWCQTLPTGRGRSNKEYFYNPILQNRSHIKHLHSLIGNHIPAQSVIVFSNRCTLKKVEVFSSDVKVTHRCKVAAVVSDMMERSTTTTLSGKDVAEIYNKLYPFSQSTEATRAQHIANIHARL